MRWVFTYRWRASSRPATAGDVADVAAAFAGIFRSVGYPEDLPRVEFPEFHPPSTQVSTPQITETCMTNYQTEETRHAFMCAFSKMVGKSGGRMQVYACTLVDDDPDYVLGETLAEALQISDEHEAPPLL